MGTDHILPQLLLLIFVPLLIEADQVLFRKIPWGIRSLINIVFSLIIPGLSCCLRKEDLLRRINLIMPVLKVQ